MHHSPPCHGVDGYTSDSSFASGGHYGPVAGVLIVLQSYALVGVAGLVLGSLPRGDSIVGSACALLGMVCRASCPVRAARWCRCAEWQRGGVAEHREGAHRTHEP